MHQTILPSKLHQTGKSYFKDKENYEETLEHLQKKLLLFQRKIKKEKSKVIILLEGRDASGKGGAISRITEILDPSGVQVYPISKPTVEESTEHYLERFWRKLPRPGNITILDRSWYGRVLVEKVENFCTPQEGKRAYEEINQLEKMLTADGILILKYFLDISYEEQLTRFKERKSNPFKTWKLTSDDWHNRKKWALYHPQFKLMLKKTDTTYCPWKTIAADSKWFARTSMISDVIKRTI